MWDPKKETTAELEAFVRRSPIGMMEMVIHDAAKAELEKRKEDKQTIFTIISMEKGTLGQSWTVIAKDEYSALSMTRDYIKDMEGNHRQHLEVLDSTESFNGSGVVAWVVR